MTNEQLHEIRDQHAADLHFWAGDSWPVSMIALREHERFSLRLKNTRGMHTRWHWWDTPLQVRTLSIMEIIKRDA